MLVTGATQPEGSVQRNMIKSLLEEFVQKPVGQLNWVATWGLSNRIEQIEQRLAPRIVLSGREHPSRIGESVASLVTDVEHNDTPGKLHKAGAEIVQGGPGRKPSPKGAAKP